MADDQENRDTYWNDGVNDSPRSQSTEKETNGSSKPDTGGADGTSDSGSMERNPGDVEDDMFMVQTFRTQDTQGMGFMTPVDLQSFLALIAPAEPTSDSETVSAEAQRALRDTNRNHEQPLPRSDPDRVGQLAPAQNSRQQPVVPTEDAWDFVRDPSLQSETDPSAVLTE